MELELLTVEEAEQRPVGMGRDEPNQHPFLDEPKYAHSTSDLLYVLFWCHVLGQS